MNIEKMNANSPNINISNNILIINQYASDDNDPLAPFKKHSENNSKNYNSHFNMEIEQELASSLSPLKQKNNSYSKKVRVCFADKISKKRLVDLVDIESFKEFNVNEDFQASTNQKNSCCRVF